MKGREKLPFRRMKDTVIRGESRKTMSVITSLQEFRLVPAILLFPLWEDGNALF